VEYTSVESVVSSLLTKASLGEPKEPPRVTGKLLEAVCPVT
jgi:hypothetical protein